MYFSWGQGSSCKLVLIITLFVEEALPTLTPLHQTLKRNTIDQIPCFCVPISMDLFKFTFWMFSIHQQVTHSTEQEAFRAQSGSHWPGPFTATSQGRDADGSFQHANLPILGLVQWRGEAEEQLERAPIETFVSIWNVSLLFKRLNCGAWSEVLEAVPEP